MKRYPYWWAVLLFLATLGYDFVVWGAASRIPEVGSHLMLSARREAPLAYAYMIAGGALDAAVPPLGEWGERQATLALEEGFARIKDDPSVAMDLVFSQNWNARHLLLKTCHWGAPVCLLLSFVLWLRRPKKVSLLGRRR